MSQPKISVITPSLNTAGTIEMALSAVIRQTYKNIEHIIIDGESTDNSLATIKKFMKKGKHIRLLTEKDTGIYHAMNKGLDMVTGDWIYFLGADDSFYNDTVIANLVEQGYFQEEQIVYGNVIIKGDSPWAKDKTIYDGPFDLEKLFKRNICHQSIFYPRSVIRSIGYYDEKYKVTSDWDYNIRCFAKYNFFYTGKIIAFFTTGGKSSGPGDYSLHLDLPSNIIKYFQIDPYDGETYQVTSPFFYPMEKYRDDENKKIIENLTLNNTTLVDKISTLQNDYAQSKNQQKTEYEEIIHKLHGVQISFWELYREKENEYQGYIKDYQNEQQHLNAYFSKKENEYKDIIKQIEKEKYTLQDQYIKNENEFIRQIEYEKKQIDHLTDIIARNDEHFRQTLNAYAQDIDRLQSVISDNLQDISDLKNVVFLNEQEIAVLKAFISGNEQEIARLKTSISINEHEITRLKVSISINEQEIFTILHSYTWKTGKALLSPAQFILRMTRKK